MKTILLVEDEALIAMTEARMLKKHGFEVLTAYNAKKALEIVNNNEIDLILMDIDLGHSEMDGTEAAEIILEEQDIPIVFLSSHTEPEVVEKTEKITSYGYIVKNSGDTVLLASLKMAFRLFEANQRIKEREEALKKEKVKLEQYIEIIEERNRIDEQRNKHLLELYEKMDSPQSDLLDYVLTASLEITNSRFAFSGLLNEDESVMTVHRWSKDAMNECSISDKPIEFPIEKSGIWGDVVRERRPIIINDYETDSRPTKHGTPAGHVAIERFLCVPLFDGNKIVAVGAAANKIRPYDMADADAITFLYDKMWSLIKQQKADQQLQESEKKFRSIYEESPIGKELYNANGELIEVNQSCLEIFGVTDADRLMGFNLFDDPNVTDEQKERLRNREKIRYEVAFDFNKVKQTDLYDTTKPNNIYLDVMITPLSEKNENVIGGYLVQAVDITERKQLERAIEKDKFRLTAIIEGTNVGTWEWNVQTGETRFNEQWAQIIGRTLEEVAPLSIETWQQYAHPEDFKNSEGLLKKHFRGESDYYELECRMKHKNGNWVWVLDRGKVATWTADGKPEWMYGTHQDITDRIQLEQELRESERNANITLNSIGDAVISTDIEGNVVRMNPVAEKLSGWNIESAEGKKIQEVFHIINTQTGKRADNPVEAALKTGAAIPLANHTALISKTGDRFQIGDSAAPIKDENGIIKGVVLVFRDETERFEREQKLRESELQLRNIIENSTNIFYSHTVDHQLTYLSPQVETILGYTIEEAKVKWTKLTSDNPINQIGYQHTMRAITTGERQAPYYLELVKKYGDKIWAEIREFPVVENGETVAIVGSLIDVTERKKLERDLEQTVDSLRLSNEEMRIIQQASMAVLEHTTFKESARTVFNLAKQITGASAGYVALLSDDGSENEVLFLDDGGLPCAADPSLPMPIRGLRAEAYRSGKAVVDNDFMNSEWVTYMPEGHVVLKNVLFAPLPIEGKVVGIMGLANKEGDFTQRNLEIAGGLGAIAAIALKNSRARDLLEAREKSLEQLLEKNTYLMKELNHRVKNNLSMISSLINLRSFENNVDLSDLSKQIDAIRIVHEQLYKKENIERIELRNYIEELLDNIFSSFAKYPIRIEKDIEDITTSSRTAIPLGLIINEIATNAIKHGFAPDKKSIFTVSLKKNRLEGQYILTLSNNGKPVPDTIDFNNSKTLGLRLISILVDQIDGAIELEKAPCPIFSIRFPIDIEE